MLVYASEAVGVKLTLTALEADSGRSAEVAVCRGQKSEVDRLSSGMLAVASTARSSVGNRILDTIRLVVEKSRGKEV